MSVEAKIIRQLDSRNFMEGLEHCREYVKSLKLWFGTSTLQPGQTGNIDRGHAQSQEVFFVAQGRVLVFDETRYYELYAGDALLIPEGLPHTLTNIGDENTLVIWAGAPGE